MKIDKNLKISMSRGQLRDILHAVDAMSENEAGDGAYWYDLYVQLASTLENYDRIRRERRRERERRKLAGYKWH